MVSVLNSGVDFHVSSFSRLRGFLGNLIANCYELFLPLIFFAGYLIVSQYQHSQRMSLIDSPKIHDFYLVDFHGIDPSSDAKYRYVPLMVKRIDQEGVTFKIGNIAHTEKVSANKHVKFDAPMQRNYFRAEELTLSPIAISELAKKKVIYDVARPKNIFVHGWVVMHLRDLQVD